MPQDQTAYIGGVYHISETLTSSDALTICTARQIQTNEMVELAIITLPSNKQLTAVRAYFQQLERRQLIQTTRIRPVYAWGQHDNQLYIASAVPRGISLQQLLDTENIEIKHAIELGQQIALGLTALHAQNIAGLDLHPHMITVDTTGKQERIQINDIALRPLLQQLAQPAAIRTGSSSNIASVSANDIMTLDPRYTPPEYLSQEPAGPWSDIYQLGLLLFTMITGRLPFIGKDAQETATLQRSQPLPELRRYKHSVPSELQEILQHAMQKDPQQRFTNAAAFIRALATIQQEPLIQVSGPIMSLKQPDSPERNSHTTEINVLNKQIEQEATQIGGTIRDGNREKITHQLPINGVYAYISNANAARAITGESQLARVERIPIIQTDTILGRHDPKRNTRPDVTLSALDPKMTISRKHARLRFSEQSFTIEDLGSHNKTRVGDRVLPPHTPVPLHHGDIIVLGSVYLRFEVPGTPDSEATLTRQRNDVSQ